MLNIISLRELQIESTAMYGSSLVDYYQRDRRMAGNVAPLLGHLLCLYKTLGLVFGITNKQINGTCHGEKGALSVRV